jgi:small-conductance mechanosensitive channel
MNQLLDAVRYHLLDPRTLIGAMFIGLVFFVAATGLVVLVRRAAKRVEAHLSDVTGLTFASALGQVLVYVAAFVLYAHLVPELRALGTALLAGVSVVSVVLGLAAQNTLGNLIAGLSLVLYRPMRVGDRVQVNTPKGVVTATVELLSLGYTTLRDADNNQILVPNSVMMGSVVIRLVGNGGEKGPGAAEPTESGPARLAD